MPITRLFPLLALLFLRSFCILRVVLLLCFRSLDFLRRLTSSHFLRYGRVFLGSHGRTCSNTSRTTAFPDIFDLGGVHDFVLPAGFLPLVELGEGRILAFGAAGFAVGFADAFAALLPGFF
jgi:hypothetical protein